MTNFWNTPISVETDILMGAIIIFIIFVFYVFDYLDDVNEHQHKFEKWREENNKYQSTQEHQLREYFTHLQKYEQLSIEIDKKLN